MKYTMIPIIGCLFFCASLSAQETFPVNDVQDQRTGAFAFVNGTIVADADTELKSGTLLIKDGRIVGMGKKLKVPEGFSTIDCTGKTLYPSLIDAYSHYGLPAPPKRQRRNFRGPEQLVSKTDGAYNANEAIKSHYNAGDEFKPDDKAAGKLRGLGFGAVLSFRADGIARGSSALVTLADSSPNLALIKAKAAAHYSFNKGSSSQSYPSSSMGAIALLRQTQMDAQWYQKQDPAPFTDQSLNAWIEARDLPQIIESSGWQSLLNADDVGDEFGVQYIIKTNGDEYRRLETVKATGASLIVPINFPKAPDVDDPFHARRVSLADMKHWEMASANPAMLEKHQLVFALTSAGTTEKTFWKNLRQAIDHGLSKAAALRALTETPAQLLRVDDQLGSLKAGKLANFLITSGDLFDDKVTVFENWIQGKRYIINDSNLIDFSGTYHLTIGETLSFNLKITGKAGKHKAALTQQNDSEPGDEPESGEDSEAGDVPESEGDPAETDPKDPKKAKEHKVKASFSGEMASLSFDHGDGVIRLSGWLSGKNLEGQGTLPNGNWTSWKAQYTGANEAETGDKDGKEKKKAKGKKGKKDKRADENAAPEVGKLVYPFVAYGMEAQPKSEPILYTNATVWTNESDGILKNTDVLVQDGKIALIGKNLMVKRARGVDATGKHLTSGIIDEHSHLALRGTNDTATNSSMVRMKDVVNSEDINIYRNLAGGVVAAQLLHGSANPVGGQSALVKMRWGVTPKEMLIEGADEFIKFALGENVKRSRNSQSIRYPQTRMGVEQVYMDAFSSARDYQKRWRAYNGLSEKDKQKTAPPRRDLVMDAMAEILDGKRFITCHSYVQSEINMLMKVAETFDFRVNTFTHILEGYKVADKMAAHGVGGSTFADWWAYKWEVRYAIPYNTTLMHNEGVVVAVNSDSREMSRRLNQEAAKSVKYGGMSEEDAWKLVTLNPAKLLHLDDRMGSIKVGKDADLVLWSENPLSIYAKVEQTLVDGIPYFDLERNEQLQKANAMERERLVKKLRKAKKAGKPSEKRFSGMPREWGCSDLMEDHGEWTGEGR